MIKLTIEQVVEIHSKIVEKTGGAEGVRDFNLLDSAINAPFQTFGGIDLYPTIEEKGARLAFSLIMNHSFYDGNKRIGAVCFLTFLKLNGIDLSYTQKELELIILSLASGEADYETFHTWIKTHTPSRCKNSN